MGNDSSILILAILDNSCTIDDSFKFIDIRKELTKLERVSESSNLNDGFHNSIVKINIKRNNLFMLSIIYICLSFE